MAVGHLRLQLVRQRCASHGVCTSKSRSTHINVHRSGSGVLLQTVNDNWQVPLAGATIERDAPLNFSVGQQTLLPGREMYLSNCLGPDPAALLQRTVVATASSRCEAACEAQALESKCAGAQSLILQELDRMRFGFSVCFLPFTLL